MSSGYVSNPMFGGAIQANTRPNLIDASDMRQVPDNQEVFMYPDSGVSIIVEILELVEPTKFEDAIKRHPRYHFDSLAHDNSAVSSQILQVNAIPNDRGDRTPSVTCLRGTQQVPKFRHTEPDQVKVLMALYRVQDKSIDLVVTFNIPLGSVDGDVVTEQQEQKAEEDFETFIRSLRIEDFSLFA